MRRHGLVVWLLAAAMLAIGVPLAEASSAKAPSTRSVKPPSQRASAKAWMPRTYRASTRGGTARGAFGAGCTAATPSQAHQSTPGTPTHVHAIAGDGSVTVTWCPPVDGQANITSYTVTSSGGQTATAVVPNNWVIVDGLKNGSSYSFTVRANTSSSSGAASAVSDPATPNSIPGPRHVQRGAPHKVTYDQYSLMIDGKRTMIYSGEFDPWRTPSPSSWIDLLQKMKADGFNAVTPYFDWDYSSPAPGVYNFGGVRDMNTFLNDAQKVGLYVIARPGPYINAETDAGGFPGWLVTQQGKARTDASDYEAAAKQWLSEIDPIIAAHQITRGGDVILYQVENELEYKEPATTNYMADLMAKVRADGIDVPLSGNHAGTFTGTAGAVQIDGFDSYPQGFNCANPNSFSNPPGFGPIAGEPLMTPEFQGGSYDAWGGAGYDNCYEMTNSDFENVFYKSNFAQGVTIQSNYMTVGGTDWGWLPAPFMYTSYDYGSAIRETGEIGAPSNPGDITGSKYGENKLLGDFLRSASPLTKTAAIAAPASTNAAVHTQARANPDDKTQFIYLRQANAASTSTASTHLALSTNPSFGYTHDDTDSALSYTGTWSHVANQNYTGGDYRNTESFSDVAGDSMSFEFTGTAVQYIAPTTSNHGIADVYLDGSKVATVDGYSSSTNFQQVLYSASDLTDTTHTLKIVVTGQKNAASSGTFVSVDAINVPTAAQQADYYPTVPQAPGTSITLQGRDARLLLANYAFDGQQLQYSTSELMTHMDLGGHALALLYGPSGTDGETVLRYDSRPTVDVVKGSVQSTWDSGRGDLRLDYTHSGLAEVKISGGGRPALELLIADKNLAEDFWPEHTSAGPVLVQGGYLVRTATSHGGTLALTGDTSSSGPITVWAPASIRAVTWNGRRVATTGTADGSRAGQLGGPSAVRLPALKGWRFRFETPEAQPFFDDSHWTLADHPTTTNPTKPTTLPVLYADDYGFHRGFIWYRGHFTATGDETGITLTANGGQHGAFSVWLNGAFIGSNSTGNQQTQTFKFPAAALRPGGDNVIAVLVQSSSHDEDGVYGNPPSDSQKNPRGLMGASLNGGSENVTWRLQGNQGAEHLQDPTRGALNATGLYGTNHGWDLPGYPAGNWSSASLPDEWTGRGVPEGIGWYRTTFDLALPRGQYSPVGVQIDSLPNAANANSRAFIFVNGWLVGQYDNRLGPQHRFYVPAGLLNDHGSNTIAIAEWALGSSGGGLGTVKLVSLGNQAGGVPIRHVDSPGYSASVYGPPSSGQPTLAASASTALAQPGQSFTVRATLADQGNAPLTHPSLTLSAPAGWTVSPASAAPGDVAPGGSVSASFTVTAPSSGLTAGPVALVAKATYATSGSSGIRTLQSGLTVEVPYASLSESFDNTGITDDSNPNPGSGFIGFDGGGTSFSEQGLTADGLTPGAHVTADGLGFTWPNVPAAQPDNTMAQGQIIDVSGSGSKLGFLAASNNSALSGTGTVYYTDGTSSTFQLGVGNFWYAAGQSGNPSNVQVAAVKYANYTSGSSGHTVYVFEQSVAIDSSKTVEAVALPPLGDVAGYNPAMHIFAVSVGG